MFAFGLVLLLCIGYLVLVFLGIGMGGSSSAYE